MLGNIKNKKLIIFKGFLFFLLIMFSAFALIEQNPALKTFFLTIILIWSSARLYYFLFYVIQNYVDSDFRYSGLFSLIRQMIKIKRDMKTNEFSESKKGSEMKTGYKIFIVLSVSFIILISMNSMIFFKSIRRQSIQRTKANLHQIVQMLARQTDSWLDHHIKNAMFYSSTKEFKALLLNKSDEKIISDADNAVLAIMNQFEYDLFFITDENGNFVVSSLPDQKKMNISKRSYFKKAVSGSASISSILISRVSGNPIFIVCTPVKDGDTVIGTIGFAMNIYDYYIKFMGSVRIGSTGYIFMTDADGNCIAHPDRSMILSENIGRFDFGRHILEQQGGVSEYVFNGQNKFAAFSAVPQIGWIIVLTASRDEFVLNSFY